MGSYKYSNKNELSTELMSLPESLVLLRQNNIGVHLFTKDVLDYPLYCLIVDRDIIFYEIQLQIMATALYHSGLIDEASLL